MTGMACKHRRAIGIGERRDRCPALLGRGGFHTLHLGVIHALHLGVIHTLHLLAVHTLHRLALPVRKRHAPHAQDDQAGE
ncbi:hypothetical protein D3C76_1529750 [compost metagenome]